VAREEQPPSDLVPSRSFGQVPGFDGVRGAAVLTIVIAHMVVLLPVHALLVIPGATASLDAFFVLSGFLISALLLKEQAKRGTIGAVPFYRRRVLRLLPALYVMVLVTALFAYFTHQWQHTETQSIFSVVFYYSNYYSASDPSPFGIPKLTIGFQHLWSLSFEEQFYVFWPWITIVLLTIRTRLRTVVIVLLSLIALVALHRFLLFQETHRWWQILIRTDTRADAILWGALVAHLWIRGKEPKRGIRFAALVASAYLLGCLFLTTEYSPFVFWGGFVGIDISCAVILLAILDGRWIGRHVFEFRPLVALGLVSYGFYLWHLPVFFAVAHYDAHWSDVVRVVVALSITLALTLLSWFLMERPLMRWSKKLSARDEARRAAAGGAAGGPPEPAVGTG
jgi:peptidoglycan/LPS O-acetylase OafA/YrhL